MALQMSIKRTIRDEYLVLAFSRFFQTNYATQRLIFAIVRISLRKQNFKFSTQRLPAIQTLITSMISMKFKPKS